MRIEEWLKVYFCVAIVSTGKILREFVISNISNKCLCEEKIEFVINPDMLEKRRLYLN